MTTSLPGVFISVVTYNSERFISAALDGVLNSEGFEPGQNLKILVVDNASSDRTVQTVQGEYEDSVEVVESSVNLGFCGGHNLAASHFLSSSCDFFLVLNPDARLAPDALRLFCEEFARFEDVGAITPLLVRCDEKLEELNPSVVDAAGMKLTRSLRHFDIESGELESKEARRPGFVFGGTGACLMLSRECVEAVSFRGAEFEEDLGAVYPELLSGIESRVQLFDEAFFAFRDDAELGWRLQRLGWRVRFQPAIRCYHHRNVLPERRADLPAKLNELGVKNRFLLQWNHFSLKDYRAAIVPGVLLRNLLVLFGVLFKERSSVRGIIDAWRLKRRARERFRYVEEHSKNSGKDVARWLEVEMREEP